MILRTLVFLIACKEVPSLLVSGKMELGRAQFEPCQLSPSSSLPHQVGGSRSHDEHTVLRYELLQPPAYT